MMKKKDPTPQPIKVDEKKLRKFAYILAWITCLASWGTAVVSAVRDKPPPDKDDYTK